MTLQDLFARYYRASILSGEPVADAMTAAREAAATDPGLKPAAHARLTEIEMIDDSRCFITKIEREFLIAVFGVR